MLVPYNFQLSLKNPDSLIHLRNHHCVDGSLYLPVRLSVAPRKVACSAMSKRPYWPEAKVYHLVLFWLPLRGVFRAPPRLFLFSSPSVIFSCPSTSTDFPPLVFLSFPRWPIPNSISVTLISKMNRPPSSTRMDHLYTKVLTMAYSVPLSSATMYRLFICTMIAPLPCLLANVRPQLR